MGQHLLTAVFAVLLAGQSGATQVQYFPSGALDEAKEHWYSEHLQALKEPPLWHLSETQKLQTYRFLWLRSFDHPISVRLAVSQDGTAVLTTKIASGEGGYKPGDLVVNRTRKLTKQQTEWFLDRIEELNFWNLPTHEESSVVGCDGAQWIVEGVRDGKYHVVDRWSPNEGPVRALGIIMLIDLAKLKLLYQEVY